MVVLKTVANILDKLVIVTLVTLPYYFKVRTSMFITIGITIFLLAFQYYLLQKNVIKTFPKIIDVTVLLLSIALLTADYFIPEESREEFEKMRPLFIYGSFFTMAFLSLLFNHPFTTQYAKNSNTIPESAWVTPRFLEVNKKITFVWMVSFLLMSISSSVPLMTNVSKTMNIILSAMVPVILIFITMIYKGGS